jgi:isoprenylcysteine carboxyl methyltransferase (ICMT) family protein YpbQ
MYFIYLSYLLSILAALRAASLLISRRNEARLRRICAKEFGAQNSIALIVTHIAFYIACIAEACLTGQFLKGWAGITGVIMYAFAIVMLYYVIVALGSVWTMKLLIGPKWFHHIHQGFLFRRMKHPNYYLNIVPELIGIAMICHANIASLIIFPVYAMLLGKRILLEEAVMKEHFDNY